VKIGTIRGKLGKALSDFEPPPQRTRS